MLKNKIIHRQEQNAEGIFNQRNLTTDYRTLLPLLKPGLRVLDIGCGTGSISKDIAIAIGPQGRVIGIDNTESFILQGKELFNGIENLELIHVDVLEYCPEEKFDLIISARTFQWVSTVDQVLEKVKSWLNPKGKISILDYDHTGIQWVPEIPVSMQQFYQTFLNWRQEAGMNNTIGKDLPNILSNHGFTQIESHVADEHYLSDQKEKIAVWSKVASSRQMVEEGYLKEELRLDAIQDYETWILQQAKSMTMRLWDVQASL